MVEQRDYLVMIKALAPCKSGIFCIRSLIGCPTVLQLCPFSSMLSFKAKTHQWFALLQEPGWSYWLDISG